VWLPGDCCSPENLNDNGYICGRYDNWLNKEKMILNPNNKYDKKIIKLIKKSGFKSAKSGFPNSVYY